MIMTDRIAIDFQSAFGQSHDHVHTVLAVNISFHTLWTPISSLILYSFIMIWCPHVWKSKRRPVVPFFSFYFLMIQDSIILTTMWWLRQSWIKKVKEKRFGRSPAWPLRGAFRRDTVCPRWTPKSSFFILSCVRTDILSPVSGHFVSPDRKEKKERKFLIFFSVRPGLDIVHHFVAPDWWSRHRKEKERYWPEGSLWLVH